ncbi:MAG: CatA-like O-acetyltransferase [Tannerellaceae bacterium]
MKREIDFESWNRKEHFDFFSAFDEPFYGLVAQLDCSKAMQEARMSGTSFFLYSLHKIMRAVNDTPEFRYRIEAGSVYDYETIHVSPTIGRADNTFAFAFLKFDPDLSRFVAINKQEMEAAQNSTGLRLNEDSERIDTIHFSSLPWIDFTGLTHARNYKTNDSIPKISVGKVHAEGEKKRMPIQINVHHGLVDGIHIANFLDRAQTYLNE